MAFQELLKTTLDNSIPLKIDITCSVKRFNYAAQQAAWSATPISSNSEIHVEYSLAIKEKIAKKRKLCKLWQTNRCQVLKNKLNRAIKALKNLLNMERNQGI